MEEAVVTASWPASGAVLLNQLCRPTSQYPLTLEHAGLTHGLRIVSMSASEKSRRDNIVAHTEQPADAQSPALTPTPTTAVTATSHSHSLDPLFVLRGHQAPIYHVQFSPTAVAHSTLPVLATCDGNGIVHVWSLQTRRSLLQFDASANAVLRHLSAQADSNVSNNVSSAQAQQLNKLSATNPTTSTNAVLSLHWLSTNHLLTQSKIGVLTIWHVDWDAKPVARVEPLHTILTQQYTFARCTVNTQYMLIASSGEVASHVSLYHYPSLQRVSVIECEQREVQQVEEVTEEDEQLHDAGAGLDRKYGMVMCMALLTNTQRPTGAKLDETQCESHDELRQHVYILVGTESGHLQLHRFPTSSTGVSAPMQKTLVALLHLHAQPVLNLDAQQSPTEPRNWIVVTGGASNNVAVCSITLPLPDAAVKASMRVINNVTLPHGGVNDLAIRSDLKVYAAACWDHRVRVYNVADHTLLAVLKYHAEHVYSVAWCPPLQQGSQQTSASEQAFELGLLASGGKDNKVAVWQLYNDQRSIATTPTLSQATSMFLPVSRAALRQQQARITQ